MSEQLYRWVKASELVPDIWTLSQSKRIPIRTHGEYYNTGIYRNVNGVEEFEIGNKETSFEKQSFHLIEWLEPLPLNADVEQAAKEYIDREETVDLVFGNDVTDISDHLKAAFIAGAGYGKGGEEKTFGQLIQSRTKVNVLSPHISDEVWKDLINDTIWTNCIPIRIFQNLLQLLEIPFWLAKESMYQTYEILWTAKQKEKVTLDTRKDLWQNKEAFDKYVNRLGELISESSRPSIDIVKQLREANPYTNVTDGVEASRSVVYSKCCDKLEELLKQNQSK